MMKVAILVLSLAVVSGSQMKWDFHNPPHPLTFMLQSALGSKADKEKTEFPPLNAQMTSTFFLDGLENLSLEPCSKCEEGYDMVKPCSMYHDTQCAELCDMEEINPGNGIGRKHSTRDGSYDNECHNAALDGHGAWCSTNNHKNSEWAQLDLGEPHTISAVVTQRRYGHNQRVTKYRMMYSQDGGNWLHVDNQRQFTGNDNNENRVTGQFAAPIKARYWRLYPMEIAGHMSVRWGLKGRRSTCRQDETCKPMELNPANTEGRTYQQIHGNAQPNAWCGAGALDALGWCGNNHKGSEWAQIDLGKPKRVFGVIMQRRRNHNQRVTRFRLQYSNDGQDFKWTNGGNAMTGNDNNDETRRERLFNDNENKGVKARYWRMIIDDFAGHMSMRWGLKGCP